MSISPSLDCYSQLIIYWSSDNMNKTPKSAIFIFFKLRFLYIYMHPSNIPSKESVPPMAPRTYDQPMPMQIGNDELSHLIPRNAHVVCDVRENSRCNKEAFVSYSHSPGL